MAERIERLEANDYEEALDFLALIFGNNNDRPKQFEKMFPLIYRPTPDRMQCNYAVRRNGRIVCMVNLFPMTWNVAGRALRIGGIGGVSTHPRWRGHGFMSMLMREIVATMKAEGYAASWLGGLRKRYEHFGYEKCGLMLEVNIRKGNYETRPKDPAQFSFQKVADEDTALLNEVKALHDAQIMHCEYDLPDFADRCRTWYGQLYAVTKTDDGSLAGYLVMDQRNGRIGEMVMRDPMQSPEALYSWMESQKAANVAMEILPHQLEMARVLHGVLENVHAAGSGNWQIFNWAEVLEALMQTRAALAPMAEGVARIGIEGAGSFELGYVDGVARCSACDGEAELKATPGEAMRLLLGSIAPQYVKHIPASALALTSWAPLPLGWSHQDKV